MSLALLVQVGAMPGWPGASPSGSHLASGIRLHPRQRRRQTKKALLLAAGRHEAMATGLRGGRCWRGPRIPVSIASQQAIESGRKDSRVYVRPCPFAMPFGHIGHLLGRLRNGHHPDLDKASCLLPMCLVATMGPSLFFPKLVCELPNGGLLFGQFCYVCHLMHLLSGDHSCRRPFDASVPGSSVADRIRSAGASSLKKRIVAPALGSDLKQN